MITYQYNLASRILNLLHVSSNNIALCFIDREYSFSELCTLSIDWVIRLERYGLQSQDYIGIKSDKSVDSYSLLIACNILGVAYAHLDNNSPKQREIYILETLKPSLIIDYYAKRIYSLSNEIDDTFDTTPTVSPLIDLDHTKQFIQKYKDRVTGDATAYVMFTSGSTGQPKGVAISQFSIMNFTDWVKETYKITKDDRFSGVNQIYFDNSIFDFYGSVYNSASLIPIDGDILRYPKKTIDILDQLKATIWFSVPSFLIFCMRMKSLTSGRMSFLRCIIFGGEGFPKSNFIKLYELLGTTIDYYNVYGPTEGTCICSSHKISDQDLVDTKNLAPLGKIASNFGYTITEQDENGVGELILTGPQISKGYLNKPTLTNERFGFQSNRGLFEKSYKTGDLVQEINNVIFFRGRVDNQIKHMGYRIELEEIESYFYESNLFIECAATYTIDDAIAGSICMHLVTRDVRPLPENVIKSVCLKIPNYMTPRRFIYYRSLPKNSNGKIDRKNLHEK
ncbi:AMP-binding protein [Amylibacter sp.]|jgi:D-alanine--poly(phosphoribitol) ligase subunit 1|nr:AMP-binding protein [Amylibacter sp.]